MIFTLKIGDSEFERLVNFVQTNYGINLARKRTLIEGRLSNVLAEKGYSDYNSFLNWILNDKSGNELITLINKLTTNHTYFMREPEHFEYLRKEVLPYFEQNNKDREIRIWSAGCSSGEEPYTLAMVIDDYFGARKSLWKVSILATDISQRVLDIAKAGVYNADGMKDIPPAWLKKYFVKQEGDKYQISPKLRSEIEFKTFNLMDKISFFKPYDLILCRNVMIYFDLPTKTALVNRFYGAHKEGGYLYIGHAESIARDATKYKYIKPAVYRK